MKAFPTFKEMFDQATLSAGGKYIFSLSKLAQRVGRGGWPAHLAAITLVFAATPTTTAIPTQVELNKGAMNKLVFSDGRNERLNCNGPQLRDFERMEQGTIINPDGHSIAGTSGRPRYFARTINLGLPNFFGGQSDFAYPCAAMKTGQLVVDGGALTDWASDCTAIAGTVQAFAHYVAYGPGVVRVPPFVKRSIAPITNGLQMSGRQMVAFLGLNATAANAAYSVGELANLTFNCGGYSPINNVPGHALTRLYQSEMGRGLYTGIQGEQADADDDVNVRDVDRTAATASKNVAADLQVVWYSPPGTRITKGAAIVDAAMALSWTGSKTSAAIALITSIVPQSPATVAGIAADAGRELGFRRLQKDGLKVKTFSKKLFTGTEEMAMYMPWEAKFEV